MRLGQILLHHGFCILEEPEAGLYPSFVADIVPQYVALIQGSQLFVSTHHPQIDSEVMLIEGRDEAILLSR